MPISTIRRLTNEDTERMEAAARRFIDRHEGELRTLYWKEQSQEDCSLASQLNGILDDPGCGGDQETQRYLRRLWLAAFRRAVRHPSADTTGYGYLGYYVA